MKKFEDVNILAALNRIMEANTAHYQSDFEIDISILRKAAESRNPADKIWLWMSRLSGTWCLRERDVFLKESNAYHVWNYYVGRTEKILAYAVELKKTGQVGLMGDLYQLNYGKHSLHVRETALPIGSITITYKHGSLEQADITHIPHHNERLGELRRFEYQPKDQELFQCMLQKECGKRQRLPADDICLHIKKLGSGKNGKE